MGRGKTEEERKRKREEGRGERREEEREQGHLGEGSLEKSSLERNPS